MAAKQTTLPAAGQKRPYLAILCILLAGSLWGCLGIFNRNLSALGIAPETVVMLRNLGACLILSLIFLVYDRSIFRIRLRHLPLFLAMGLVSILFFTLCYFRSQQVSSLAVAAILLYTAPTFVVLLSALLWKDRITKRKLLALVLAFLGCCWASAAACFTAPIPSSAGLPSSTTPPSPSPSTPSSSPVWVPCS